MASSPQNLLKCASKKSTKQIWGGTPRAAPRTYSLPSRRKAVFSVGTDEVRVLGEKNAAVGAGDGRESPGAGCRGYKAVLTMIPSRERCRPSPREGRTSRQDRPRPRAALAEDLLDAMISSGPGARWRGDSQRSKQASPLLARGHCIRV